VATNVQEAVVAGSAHWLMEDRPVETVALIRGFSMLRFQPAVSRSPGKLK
jgi:hypothetical protein